MLPTYGSDVVEAQLVVDDDDDDGDDGDDDDDEDDDEVRRGRYDSECLSSFLVFVSWYLPTYGSDVVEAQLVVDDDGDEDDDDEDDEDEVRRGRYDSECLSSFLVFVSCYLPTYGADVVEAQFLKEGASSGHPPHVLVEPLVETLDVVGHEFVERVRGW